VCDATWFGILLSCIKNLHTVVLPLFRKVKSGGNVSVKDLHQASLVFCYAIKSKHFKVWLKFPNSSTLIYLHDISVLRVTDFELPSDKMIKIKGSQWSQT